MLSAVGGRAESGHNGGNGQAGMNGIDGTPATREVDATVRSQSMRVLGYERELMLRSQEPTAATAASALCYLTFYVV